MKKGFTLIELLTVIVIMAIIGVMVIPIIINAIESSKIASAKQTAQTYSSTIASSITACIIKDKATADGTYSIDDLPECVKNNTKFSGTAPSKGEVIIFSGVVTSYSLVIDNYVVNSDGTVITNDSKGKYFDAILNGADPVLAYGMIPVVISNDGTVTKADVKDGWYKYEDQEWANMVLIDLDSRSNYINAQAGDVIPADSILAYYVWIPRYKYEISGNNISIIFENKDNINTDTNYLTHPAFNFNNAINGFWFAKFETSGTITQPTSLPNNSPLVYQNINSYNIAAKIFNTYLPGEVDAHISKNSEWGAVAYLANSSYGRCKSGTCTEVSINNNSSYKTGYSAGKPGDSMTTAGTTYAYNANEGYLASTTDNITGVYDMSGGAWEYVMGNYNSRKGNSGFSTMPVEPYINIYDSTDVATACNEICYGEALSETAGWNSDHSQFVTSGSFWLTRGGAKYDGAGAGIFSYYYASGSANGYTTFRSVIINK